MSRLDYTPRARFAVPKPPKPLGKKRANEEDMLHRSVAGFLRRALNNPAEAYWFHTPNQGIRSAIQGAKLKAMGMRPGVPDIVVRWPGNLGWIELKAAAGVVSDAQKLFMAQAAALGDFISVCRSVEEVQATLKSWGLTLHASLN